MSKEQVLGVIRHVLTFVGGVFVSKGVLDDASSMEIVGALSTLIGTIWSVVVKK